MIHGSTQPFRPGQPFRIPGEVRRSRRPNCKRTGPKNPKHTTDPQALQDPQDVKLRRLFYDKYRGKLPD
jgi:hypothetical protein